MSLETNRGLTIDALLFFFLHCFVVVCNLSLSRTTYHFLSPIQVHDRLEPTLVSRNSLHHNGSYFGTRDTSAVGSTTVNTKDARIVLGEDNEKKKKKHTMTRKSGD